MNRPLRIPHDIETKELGGDDDQLTIEQVVKEFGGYHADNKKLFTGVSEEQKALRKEMEELELRLSRPGGSNDGSKAELFKAKNLATEFMRTGMVEGKTLSRSSDPAGGYTVQDELDKAIQDQLISFSPMRSIARVMNVGGGIGDILLPIGRRGAASSWVGEEETRSATATPTLGLIRPMGGEIMSYAKSTQWLIDDSSFDIEAWLQNNIADEHAYQEGVAFITGSGVNRPIGLLTNTPVTTADATRALGILKYLPTGVSGGFPVSAPGDMLLDLVFDLTTPYRAGARFLMNSNTAKVVRKFKDGQGTYLWQASLQSGMPDMLLGYPVTIDENMPDIAANSLSIAFGNFTRGYVIVDRLGTRMVRDPYTEPGWIKFYVFKRVMGSVQDSNAIRLLKFSTT